MQRPKSVMRGVALTNQLLRTVLALAAGISLLGLDASAQTSAKVYRIICLGTGQPNLRSANQMAFYDELRKRGYVEGQNVVIERRHAANQPDQLPALARELVALRPDLIVAEGPQPSRAVKDATSTIPIVMIAVADPVGVGLVTNLARPGGNLTGVATLPASTVAKSLDLLHQIAPKATRIGILTNPANAMHQVVLKQDVPEAARKLGLEVFVVEARTPDEIEPAINAAVGKRAEALVSLGDSIISFPPERVPQLVARTGLPAIYFFRTQVQAGGLMSFGPDFPEMYRRAGRYVDRILKGEKPGDLAIEQPTKIDLVINSKTAQTLGLTISPALRVQAELIE